MNKLLNAFKSPKIRNTFDIVSWLTLVAVIVAKVIGALAVSWVAIIVATVAVLVFEAVVLVKLGFLRLPRFGK